MKKFPRCRNIAFGNLPKFGAVIVFLHAIVVPLSFPISSFGSGNGAIYTTDMLGTLTLLLVLIGLLRPGRLLRIAVIIFVFSIGVSLVPLTLDVFLLPLALKWLRLVFNFLPLILVVSYIIDRNTVRTFFFLMALAGVVSVIIGILGFFYQWPSTTGQTFDYENGPMIGRAGGLTKDSSAFGSLIANWAILSGVAFHLMLPSTFRIIFGLLMGSVTAVGLYVSLSRSAALHLLVVALLICCLLIWRLNWKALLWIICVGITLYLLGQFLISANLFVTIERRFFSDIQGILGGTGSAQLAGAGRFESWHKMMSFFAASPVFGIGYKASSVIYNLPPDNTYIGLLAETGVVGFGGFLIFIAALSVTVMSSELTGSYKWILMAIWAGFLVHGAFVDVFSMFSSAPLVLISTGLLLQQTDGRLSCQNFRAPLLREGWGFVASVHREPIRD